MNIVILDDYQNEVRTLGCFDLLHAHQVHVYNDTVRGLDALKRRLVEADAVVLIRDRTWLTAELIEHLPRLKLVSSICRVGDHIDVDACTRKKIAVADGGPGYAPATVELTWALILASMRKLCPAERELREGRWQTVLGIGCLHGRSLGIYGYGRLGKMVAAIGLAFGMRVVVFGRENSLRRAREDGYATADTRKVFFRECDVISLHLRLSDSTRGIVTEADLSTMKTDALFVNTSRAELVAPGALAAALGGRRPGYAAVDVYEEEPVLDANHPLLRLDNVVCSPHLGFADRDSYEVYFRTAFKNIVAFANHSPENIVNPTALEV